MLNILWLSHIVPYPPKGGVLQRSYNLIRETARYHRVHLVAFDQCSQSIEESNVEDSVHELGKTCQTVKVVRIPCEEWKYGKHILALVSLFTKTPYTLNWLYSNKMRKLLRDSISATNYDVVHFDTISLAIYLDLAKNIRKVLNHHNIESHMMLRRAENENQISKRYYFFQEGNKIKHYEKELCGKFDINITCSQLDSDRLSCFVPGIKLEVIPNGVDLEYFHPLNLEKDKKTLIFAGGMGAYTNRKAMIYFSDHIWPLLKKSIPGIKMIVIGRNPPESLLNISRKDDDFTVTGYVDDVRPYLDRSTVYVCPIQEGGGTKLKILDALAMGKPIVADPNACEGIDVVDGETVLFARNPEEYVEKINHLLIDQRLCREMGERAIRLVKEKYSYEKIGQRLSGMYESIMRPSVI